MLLDLPAGDGSRANEKRESQAIPQAKTGRPCCVSSCHLRCLACFLLLFLVFPLGAFSSYTRARSRCASAGTSDEASQVDWRPLDENLGQRASIFALGGTQPIDFAFAAVAQIALPTAIRFDRSWASRYALTLPCLKAYPKGFLRLARAIASAHQAPFFPATSHAAKTQIPPAYANEAPARKTLRAPGRGGREASNEPL